MDDITEAVLARQEVARFLQGSHGLTSDVARTRVLAYLDELKTTQRYELYRALEYPLYPDSPQDRTHRREPAAGGRRRQPRPRRLCLEPPQPHRLSRRTARAGRCGDSAADHRRRHQSLRRTARADSQARHRRDADSPQHQGSGVPDHAQGLRRRAAAQARPVLLSRGRAQLQRRAEAGEDRPHERVPRRRRAAACRSCRSPSRTISCSRITCSPVRASSGGSGRSAARSPRWCAMPSAIARARLSRFGRPIALDSFDAESRKSVADLARLLRGEIGRLYKVLPTAVLASAMRPSVTRPGSRGSHQGPTRHAARGRREPGRRQRRRSDCARDRTARNPRHHRR